jgi:hypothetical protein
MSEPGMRDPAHRRPADVSLSRGNPAGGRGLVVLTIAGAIAAVAISMPGCGKAQRERAVVTGKVTYNGKPLRFGTVILEPEMGQYSTGAIQPDGTFRMTTRGEGDGVPVGKCRVRFVCFSNQDPAAKPASAENDGTPNEGPPLGEPLIPEKYLSSATSGITVDVKPGDNEPLVFELTD